jgi:mRNA interferase HigB
MRIVARRHLVEYAQRHPSAAASLEQWERLARRSVWASMNEVAAAFSKAKGLNSERARFEVAGGNHRLIVAFDFRRQIAWIKFVGTHREYDRVDALTVSMF